MIVGISGLCTDKDGNKGSAGAGKSTVAGFFKREGYVEISLADPIKRMAKHMWDFSDDQLWGPSAMRNAPDERYGGLTPRRALQQLGEAGRAIDPDVWVRMVLRDTLQVLEGRKIKDDPIGTVVHLYGRYDRTKGVATYGAGKVPGVVIPDVRYKNEKDAIYGVGCNIRVRRFVEELSIPNTHRSENDLNDVPDSDFQGIIYGGEPTVDLLAPAVNELMKRLSSRDTLRP